MWVVRSKTSVRYNCFSLFYYHFIPCNKNMGDMNRCRMPCMSPKINNSTLELVCDASASSQSHQHIMVVISFNCKDSQCVVWPVSQAKAWRRTTAWQFTSNLILSEARDLLVSGKEKPTLIFFKNLCSIAMIKGDRAVNSCFQHWYKKLH